jgi:hypothetical protein
VTKIHMNHIDEVSVTLFNKGVNISAATIVYAKGKKHATASEMRIGLRGARQLYDQLGTIIAEQDKARELRR